MKFAGPSSLFLSWLCLLLLFSGAMAHGDDGDADLHDDYPHCDQVPNTNSTVTDEASCAKACEVNNLHCQTVGDNGGTICGAKTFQNSTLAFSCFCGPEQLGDPTILCQGFSTETQDDDDDDDNETTSGAGTVTGLSMTTLAAVMVMAMLSY